jgi:SulP family sulfate permease
VLIGVGLAVILYVFRQSNQVTVMEWQRPSDRYPLEVAAPAVVPSDAVTILVPYGSLFFATASLFTDRLPQITPDTRRAVVILNLRRNTELGSTFLDAIDRYARKLHAQDSKLVLSGVDPQLKEQLEQTGKIDLIGRENIYMQTEYIGQSMENAYIDAQRWVAERQPVAAP